MTEYFAECKKVAYGGYELKVSHNGGVNWQRIYFRNALEMGKAINSLVSVYTHYIKRPDKGDEMEVKLEEVVNDGEGRTEP